MKYQQSPLTKTEKVVLGLIGLSICGSLVLLVFLFSRLW